jgi:hypothetical protein
MAEITDTGYVLKTQNEWFAEEQELYLDIDPNWNLDASTPDGLKLASDAEIWANLDELGQRAYNSKDPNKAKDYDLDVICSLTGTTRNQGTPSTVTLTVKGTSGTVIAAGKLVSSTYDSTQWSIDTDVTIGAGGTATVTATCTTDGATQASIGTLTRIVSTVGGWQSVTNASVATPGTDVQSNQSLRLERKRSVSRPGNAQIDNMTAELFAVDNVTRVRIYENDTRVDNFYGQGLPANSIAPIVEGGTVGDVAKAIFRKKNPGCMLYARGTSVTVEDVYDLYETNAKDITFSRPVYVDMIVNVTIKNDGTLPSTIEDLIGDAILEYAQGTLIDESQGFNSTGFEIGENVPVLSMMTPINSVIGSYGNSYVTSLTVNGSSGGEVSIDYAELSRWTSDNVTVTTI